MRHPASFRLRRLIPVAAVAALAGASALLLAGPLDPPAGPVTPSYKTLSEIQPRTAVSAANTPGDNDATPSLFKISLPGSYYLTGNITGVNGRIGIEIAAGGVTLDLNGFDVVGVGGSLDGIATTVSSLSDIVVRHGSVRNWAGDGVDFFTSLSFNSRVEDLQASSNSGVGIRAGNAFLVSRCGTRGNFAGGFASGNQGMFSQCFAISNNDTGFSVGQGVSITDCASSFNLGTATGIISGGYATIVNCVLDSNIGGNGILTGPVSTITACALTGANLDGINAGNGSTISGCSVEFSQNVGIVLASNCTVTGCTVQFSRMGGLQCQDRNVIRGNTWSSNTNGAVGPTLANIRVVGTDNRLEENSCNSAQRGIRVEAAGNFIARNTCTNNSTANWDILAGNVCLVISATTTSTAILGNSGGTAPGSTDPNANYTY